MKGNEEILVFCNNVKLLRKQNCLSKENMAKIMGVSVGDLSKIESGNIPESVYVDTIFNLAEYFNMRLHELFSTKPQGDKNIQ